jgi:hypothetical protein
MVTLSFVIYFLFFWKADWVTISITVAGYKYSDQAQAKFTEFMNIRKEFPYFSNARTVRNCMERARRVAATRILKDALDNGTQVPLFYISHYIASMFHFQYPSKLT